MSWKPDGYPDVSAYLVVARAQPTITFLERVFGATTLRRFDNAEGGVMHAELRIGDSVVMIGESGGDWPAVPSFLHVYVEDVDSVFRYAVELGGEAVQEPARKDGDPDRRGGFRDPGGNTWWVSTQGGKQ